MVLGAASALAEATLRVLAPAGPSLLLVGRNGPRLDTIADDLRVRGAKEVACFIADLADPKCHGEVLDVAKRTLGEIDVALVAYGTLGSQAACEASFEETERELTTNFLSVVSFGTLLANEFEARRAGCLVVISSVAGDRTRR
ncbi:MAG TPA: short-chain dehydrogenase, partial [Deltaproteobacteria bacterium]|nr:short-chain dehydrogenase [Deltaproteobacteria bacterium]